MQQLDPTCASLIHHSLSCFPEDFFEEDIEDMRKTVHHMTMILIESCRSCIMIHPDLTAPNPILCAKTRTNDHPTWVNVDHCFSCGAFRQP
jgi:hypothetical protein